MLMIIQGTTPTHTFTLPFDTSNVKDIMITYIQDGDIIFVKKLKDCTLNNTKILVDLSQADTFALQHEYLLTIELKVLTTNNKVVGDTFENLRIRESKNKEEFNL
jgi:hypothetical protein